MHWDSPWGDGFPGWHIECSAMSMKYLGESYDIHTGGIDHITVHHPNEIAQSEAATGKPLAKYWVHFAFLMVDGKKMSKSLGNYYTIEDVFAKKIDPIALRYFYLTAHYRKPLNFTWEALSAAENSLTELRRQMERLRENSRNVLSSEKLEKVDSYRKKFDEALSDDMNMPQALAVLWEMLKSNVPAPDKYDLLLDFDEVLGLNLKNVVPAESIPEEILQLAEKRQQLRLEKKFSEADDVRKEIEQKGFTIEDSLSGVSLHRNQG